jgi:hypothetical protein
VDLEHFVFLLLLDLFVLMLMIIGGFFAEKRDKSPLHFARGYQNNVGGQVSRDCIGGGG